MASAFVSEYTRTTRGEKCYPMPWSALDYDKNRSAYVVDSTKEQLEGRFGSFKTLQLSPLPAS